MYTTEKAKLIKTIDDLKSLSLLNLEGGGFAIRVSKEHMLVSPTGLAEERRWNLKEQDIIVVGLDGYIIEKGDYLPSPYFPIIRHLLKNYPDCNAFGHLHLPYSQAFSSLLLPIPNAVQRVDIMGLIPCIESPNDLKVKQDYLKNPYPIEGMPDFTKRPEVYLVFNNMIPHLDKAFLHRKDELKTHGLAFTVEKHGLFGFARTLEETVENMFRVESSARAAIFSKVISI